MRIRHTARIATATLALGLFAASCGDGATVVDAGAPNDSTANIFATTEQLIGGDDFGGSGQFDFGSLVGQEAVLWFWAPW